VPPSCCWELKNMWSLTVSFVPSLASCSVAFCFFVQTAIYIKKLRHSGQKKVKGEPECNAFVREPHFKDSLINFIPELKSKSMRGRHQHACWLWLLQKKRFPNDSKTKCTRTNCQIAIRTHDNFSCERSWFHLHEVKVESSKQ